MDIGKLLFTIVWRKRKFIEKLLPNDLTPLEFKVLAILCRKESASQKEIQDLLGLTKGTVSKVVRNLESKGYIRRTRRGKSYTVELTEAGREKEKTVDEIARRVNEKIFRDFSEDERRELTRLLNKVLENLKD